MKLLSRARRGRAFATREGGGILLELWSVVTEWVVFPSPKNSCINKKPSPSMLVLVHAYCCGLTYPPTRAAGLFYILFSLVGWRAGYTNNPTFAKLFMIGFPATFMIGVCESFVSPGDEAPLNMVWSALSTMYFFKVRFSLLLKKEQHCSATAATTVSSIYMPTHAEVCLARGVLPTRPCSCRGWASRMPRTVCACASSPVGASARGVRGSAEDALCLFVDAAQLFSGVRVRAKIRPPTTCCREKLFEHTT